MLDPTEPLAGIMILKSFYSSFLSLGSVTGERMEFFGDATFPCFHISPVPVFTLSPRFYRVAFLGETSNEVVC